MLTKEQHKQIDYIVPLFETKAWSGFSNQPSNDGIEIVSNNAADTQLCTVFGTDNTTGALTYETVTLTGTTPVATVKTDWGNIYGAFLGDIYGKNVVPATGTITFREASADQTITTIAATKTSTGLVGFSIQGRNVTVAQISGNLWLYPDDAATANNGYPFASGEKLNICTPELITLISDGTGATAKIIVWK